MHPDAYHEMAQTEAQHWWFAGRRANLAALLSHLKLPRQAKILEVGAGTGGNLDMLSAFGQVQAIEMDAAARSIAAEKTAGRYPIAAGSCPDNLPVPDGAFDLVCLLDVLEHIDDDSGTLESLRKLLTRDGYLVITVPAHPWLFGQHDIFLHHKRRYTVPELRRKLEAAGLRIEKLSYLNMFLFPLAVAARLKDRLFPSANATGSGVPPGPVNRVLYWVFSAERHLLWRFSLPFGVSLLAILRAS